MSSRKWWLLTILAFVVCVIGLPLVSGLTRDQSFQQIGLNMALCAVSFVFWFYMGQASRRE